MNKVFENEKLFAETNDKIVRATKKIAASALPEDFILELYCECVNKKCFDRVSVALDEYTSRKKALTFFVLPDHLLPEYEYPVSKTDAYWVIKKRPDKLNKEFKV
jgi:hypothetical protein